MILYQQPIRYFQSIAGISRNKRALSEGRLI